MNNIELAEFARLGVATVYEASGRKGLVDIPLHQIIPHSRVAGIARTIVCTQDDNLMVHLAIEHIQPGEIVVIAMPQPNAIALVGELLATQIQFRQAAGILIDAAVRDVEELQQLGLPIWCSFIRARGAQRSSAGQINVALEMGGTTINPNDIVVLDADGAVVVAAEHANDVLQASKIREERERGLRTRFAAGELSIDVYQLRGKQ